MGNEIITLEHTATLKKFEEEAFGNQMKYLYDSMEQLGSKKLKEDKFEFELADLNKNFDKASKKC